MIKIKIVFLCFIVFTCSVLKGQERIDIINDYQFLKKIGLQGASSSEPSVKAYLNPFSSNANDSFWLLAEWGSKNDLLHSKAHVDSKTGVISYSNQSKSISFKKDSDDMTIGLEVLGSVEIKNVRGASDNFPGILLGQEFKQPHRLETLEKLQLSLDTRLVYVKNQMKPEDYKEALHTAQITLYFSLGNINFQSKGYGDYLWFGVPIYDYRFEKIETSWMQDTGIEGATQKFIFIPPAKEFYVGTMHDKEWKNIQKDILSQLKDAFTKAKEMGYLSNSHYEDMGLTSTNFGWEMPGIFDGKYEFKNLRLEAVLKR